MDKWSGYVDELGLDNIDKDLQEGLTQIILYKIVCNRYVIQRIKKGVKM